MEANPLNGLKTTTLIGWAAIVLVSSAGQPVHLALAQPVADRTELQQAQAALQEGHYADAELQLRAMITQHPEAADAHYHLGLSLHLQDQLEGAIAAYQTAIHLDPSQAAPLINLGLAFIELKQLDAAAPLFRTVLTLPEQDESPASTHTLAHYNLAIISKRQGHSDIAFAEVQAALAIAPDFVPAQDLLHQLQSEDVGLLPTPNVGS